MRKNCISERIATLCILLSGSIAAHAQQENLETILDIHHIFAYLVAGLLIMIFVMLFHNRLVFYREKVAQNLSDRLNTQLSMIIDANKSKIWTYDVTRELFAYSNLHSLRQEKFTSFDFSTNYNREDFQTLLKAIHSLEEGEQLSETLNVRSSVSEERGERSYEINLSILRRDKKGAPAVLLGIQNDVTEEKERTEKARKLMLRYQTVFNSSLVDMSYYDSNGILTEANAKACETFMVTDRSALLKRKVKITDIPAYNHLDLQHIDSFMISSRTDISKTKEKNERIPEMALEGTIYYEADVKAIRDERGELTGIVTAGRNITEMVESFHKQRQASQLLSKTTAEIQNYIENINYALRVSNVLLLNYYPDTHELEMFSDLNNIQYRMTQLRAVTLLQQKEHRRARGYLFRMDHREDRQFSATFCTILRDKKRRFVYLSFHVMPIYDKEGRVSHYFGMCQNETEMTYTELMLQEETAKARETDQLKDSFLQNMSYELRTPLNALVGFAELYNGEHSPEDEPIFAEEIRNNTNILLKLINDILFISRLDAHMIEFTYQPCDFATLFDGWCYMGWSALGPGVKTVVENPYNHLEVSIDQQNLGMVIQRLCTYSAYDLKEGFVRAKYEYRQGELMITIEDTGEGVPAEALATIFNRFVRDSDGGQKGTGLDLPIVKELIEQMGGTIELQSEAGKGTAFYVSIPCEQTGYERKSEITA